jgi:hypothetical protein
LWFENLQQHGPACPSREIEQGVADLHLDVRPFPAPGLPELMADADGGE